MPLKERLAEGNEDALEDVDELDLAYLQRMKKSGMDEDLLKQFQSITSEMNGEEKEKVQNGSYMGLGLGRRGRPRRHPHQKLSVA